MMASSESHFRVFEDGLGSATLKLGSEVFNSLGKSINDANICIGLNALHP